MSSRGFGFAGIPYLQKRKQNDNFADVSMAGTSVDGSLHIPSADTYADDVSSIGTFSTSLGRLAPPAPIRQPNLPVSSPSVVLDQSTFHSEDGSTFLSTQKEEELGEKIEVEVAESEDEFEDERNVSTMSSKKKKRTYVPYWITESSPALRYVIIGSGLLLACSILLVAVSIMVSNRGNSPQPQSSSQTLDFRPNVPSPRPPVSAPAPQPTGQIAAPPTRPPTVDIDANVVFFVVGGQNNFSPSDLARLPSNNNEWIVHLGDFSNSKNCDLSSYENVANTFKSSPIPVYFLPGEKDWTECNNPNDAWRYWKNNLSNYYRNGVGNSRVMRQNSRIENFSFRQGRVLNIGLNMVGGDIDDGDAWMDRLVQNFAWVSENVELYAEETELVTIFGNSAYNSGRNSAFFIPLLENIPKWVDRGVKLFLYVTETDSKWSINQNYLGNNNFILINIQGGIWPPMQITIDTVSEQMKFDPTEWYNSLPP